MKSFGLLLSSTSTVRGFATGTLCANNVHGENFLKDIKDGMKKGMHVSL